MPWWKIDNRIWHSKRRARALALRHVPSKVEHTDGRQGFGLLPPRGHRKASLVGHAGGGRVRARASQVVKSRAQDLQRLVERLVRVDSRLPREEDAAQVIAREIRDLGLEPDWQQVAP